MVKVILSTIVIFFYGLCPVLAAKSGKITEPVEWQNPLPKITDLGIDFEEVENLIGDNGQFIYTSDPKEITCWTKEGEKKFPAENIVTAIKIVHVPVEKAREAISDYSLISKIKPQHQNVELISKKDNHTLFSFDQVYKFSFIKMDSNFILQQTLENDGSISTLLHKGDVESKIKRYEFIPLDENKTIIALTSWSALSTAKYVFKVILSAMDESHLMASVCFATMSLEQVTNYIDKDWLTERRLKLSKKSINNKMDIPIYNKKLSTKGRQLIESLVPGGYVCLRTLQFAKVDGEEIRDLRFFTVFDNINVPSEYGPAILDYNTFPESFPRVTSQKIEKVPEGIWLESKTNYGKYFFPMIIYTNQIFTFIGDNIMTFMNPTGKGAFSPFSGAWEWSQMNNKDAILFTLSQTLKVGPDANIFFRTFDRLIPDAENFLMATGGLNTVELRKQYLEKKYSASVN